MNTSINIARDEALVAESYERVKAELEALDPEGLPQVNLDVQVAVSTILGTLPEIRVLRERMVKELPAFDVASFDKLEDYVQALAFAQAKYQFATQPPGDFEAVSSEAAKLREKLLANAQALALSGLFDGMSLENLKGANGNRNVAQDLQALSTAMRESWARIEGKSPLAAEDLQAASRVALRLTRLIGLKEQGPALLAAATELRTRAFALVLDTYEEARLAVAYLRRREGDADSIAPSLYSGKGRRRAVEEPGATTATATGGSPPVVAATGTNAPGGSPATQAVPAPSSPANGSVGGPFI
jgi:hypothetical protein